MDRTKRQGGVQELSLILQKEQTSSRKKSKGHSSCRENSISKIDDPNQVAAG